MTASLSHLTRQIPSTEVVIEAPEAPAQEQVPTEAPNEAPIEEASNGQEAQ